MCSYVFLCICMNPCAGVYMCYAFLSKIKRNAYQSRPTIWQNDLKSCHFYHFSSCDNCSRLEKATLVEEHWIYRLIVTLMKYVDSSVEGFETGWNGKICVNAMWVRIWRKVILAYFKVLWDIVELFWGRGLNAMYDPVTYWRDIGTRLKESRVPKNKGPSVPLSPRLLDTYRNSMTNKIMFNDAN